MPPCCQQALCSPVACRHTGCCFNDCVLRKIHTETRMLKALVLGGGAFGRGRMA